MKKFLSLALILCIGFTCLIVFPETSSAACKHKYTDGSSRYGAPQKRVTYQCTSSKPIGSRITGGWIRKSGVQKVLQGESASNIAGKSFSTSKTVSFNITGSALKGALEAKLGCSKTWKNSKYYATATNSSRNKTNNARFIAYFTQNSYQKYKLVYKVRNQQYCLSCRNWITQSTATKTAYAYKKTGTDGAFFYSDSKAALTNQTKVCLYKDGIMYEDFSREGRGYLAKNGSILKGAAEKNNQNYNAFSNIKRWY